MFTEELTVIRDAEKKSDEIKHNAKLKAKEILDSASNEASEILVKAEITAKEEYQTLITEGNDIALKNYNDSIKIAKDEAQRLEENAKKIKPEIIKFIAERVKSSGNS